MAEDTFRVHPADYIAAQPTWRQSSSLRMFLLAGLWACVIGLSAQIKVPLPYTPVPMTLQTLPVLLAGIVLGGRWGAASVVIYIAAGVAGVPWFTQTQGWAALAGPTGGYLIGFIGAAGLLGWLFDRYRAARGFWTIAALMALANIIVIYGLGLMLLGLWLNLVKGSPASLSELLAWGMTPFLLGDAVKIALAASAVKLLNRR